MARAGYISTQEALRQVLEVLSSYDSAVVRHRTGSLYFYRADNDPVPFIESRLMGRSVRCVFGVNL